MTDEPKTSLIALPTQNFLGAGLISQQLQEDLKHFRSMGSVFENQIKAFQDAVLPHQEIFKSLAKDAETMRLNIKEGLLLPNFQDIFATLTDSTNVFQGLLEGLKLEQGIFERYKGLWLDVPLIDSLKQLNAHAEFSVSLRSFHLIKEDTGILQTDVAESKTYGITEYRISASLDLRLSKIEMLAEQTDQKLGFLISDAENKDAMLVDLLKFAKANGTTITKIEQIDYINHQATLIIGGHPIQLRPNSNQSEFCRVIFTDEASMRKLWNFDELLEIMDDKVPYTKEWGRKLYHVAYELNKKIEAKTGKENFFIPTITTVAINPRYC